MGRVMALPWPEKDTHLKLNEETGISNKTKMKICKKGELPEKSVFAQDNKANTDGSENHQQPDR